MVFHCSVLNSSRFESTQGHWRLLRVAREMLFQLSTLLGGSQAQRGLVVLYSSLLTFSFWKITKKGLSGGFTCSLLGPIPLFVAIQAYRGVQQKRRVRPAVFWWFPIKVAPISSVLEATKKEGTGCGEVQRGQFSSSLSGWIPTKGSREEEGSSGARCSGAEHNFHLFSTPLLPIIADTLIYFYHCFHSQPYPPS